MNNLQNIISSNYSSNIIEDFELQILDKGKINFISSVISDHFMLKIDNLILSEIKDLKKSLQIRNKIIRYNDNGLYQFKQIINDLLNKYKNQEEIIKNLSLEIEKLKEEFKENLKENDFENIEKFIEKTEESVEDKKIYRISNYKTCRGKFPCRKFFLNNRLIKADDFYSHFNITNIELIQECVKKDFIYGEDSKLFKYLKENFKNYIISENFSNLYAS